MSSEDILNPEEVDFLLGGKAEQEISFLSSEVQEVTMRGDLEHMGLADVFQTLALSKMEGVLRVKNPMETREVFFRDGRCRCAPPARSETRRLGQFLIRAGYITPEQLRTALVEQKQRKIPVGQVLVEQGLVPADELEELALGQFTEDLFAMFTWQRGIFEFYKGGIVDDVHRARMESLPEFEVATLLLEVARRTDEWSGILQAVGKLEEVPRVSALVDGISDLPIEQVHHTVLDAVNGRFTFRDLGDSTMLGLFATARAARDLFHWGVLELLPSAEMLDVAEFWVGEGEHKRAVATVQTLYERQESMASEDVRDMADVLSECGEGRLAGGLLLEHAQVLDDSELAIEMVRHARELSPRDREVLTELDRHLRGVAEHAEEHQSVLIELVDCCLADHALDEAAQHVAHLEEIGAPPTAVLSRRAVIQAKQKDSTGAIATYEELVAIHQESGDRKRLSEVYERILKLDHNRRDIARALRVLHTTRSDKVRRAAIAVFAVLTMAYFGWDYWRTSTLETILAKADSEVRGLVHSNDLNGAQSTLAAAIAEWGDPLPFVDVQQAIDSARAAHKASEMRAERLGYRDSLAEAASLLEGGQLGEALTIYARLLGAGGKRRQDVLEIVKVRLDAQQTQFADLNRTLPFKLPSSPTTTTPRSEIASALAVLKESFPESLLTSVDGVLALEGDEALEALAGAERAAELIGSARKMRQLIGKASVLLAQYEEASAAADINSQLNPVFLAAREHEANNRFEEALTAYDTLAHSKLRDESLRSHFTERFEYYRMVVGHLRALQQATAASNFEVAVQQLRTLQNKVPDVPFSTMVTLPLVVASQPTGAKIFVDGEPVGTTPMTLRYVPGHETIVEVRRDGFVSENIVVSGDHTSRFSSFMARTPAWAAQAPGAVDQAVTVGRSGVAFVVDRSGSCTAVSTTRGKQLWTLPTNDLSGFLSRPALADTSIVLTSIDGPVRKVDQQTGEVLWTVPKLPSEVGAIVSRSNVVVATDDTVVCLDLGTGAEQWRRTLDATITAHLTLVDHHVLATSRTGRVLLMQGVSGATVWEGRAGRGITSPPLATPTGVVVVAEDGSVTMLDSTTGQPKWKREDLGELPHAPVTTCGQLFLSRHEGILALNLDSGETIATLERRGLCSPPAVAGARLLVAVKDGNVLVLDPTTLAILYRLKTQEPALAAATVDSEGRVMITTERGRMLGFQRLP